MLQPSHGHPHRNHFHVRIYRPPADRPRCEDREPAVSADEDGT